MHQLLRQLGDNWSVALLELLDGRPVRFSDAARAIDGISEKMLASTVRTLEADGLVERTAYPEVPPRVEYALTARGDELMARMMPLMEWIAHNASEIVAR